MALIKNAGFLLDSPEPWIVYRSLVDLFGFTENDAEVSAAKSGILADSRVCSIIEELQGWPGVVLSSHKSAGQLYHKLSFLAEIGLKREDADFSVLCENLSENISEEGLFRLPAQIPEYFGGTGQKQYAWALCDCPLLMYSVVKMGLMGDKTGKGLEFLIGLLRENGWPCRVSKELGNFRGPGKKEDPCPYANLIVLKLLALFKEYSSGREARTGVECLLGLWEKSSEQHPYMFFMGNDFRKLKAPFIWYDILHAADVLSQYEFAVKDERFIGMLETINSKADKDGLFTPGSEWKAWKGWEFCQKKKPSAWLTFLVYRINKRANPEWFLN
jgi:hypothetical protein